MAGPNIEELLRQGVDAARSGDKLTARRLLQQVLLNDKNNITALMWMASVVDTLEDRRAYLQRVLQVDPNNERAREALRRLGGVPAAAASPAPSRPPSPAVSNAGGSRTGLFVLAMVALVAVVMIVLVLTTPGLVDTQAAVQPSATIPPATAVSAETHIMPTLTMNAVIVPFEDRATTQPLPPTFTSPPTLEPTAPPTETPLPPAISQYSYIASDLAPDAAASALRFFNGANELSGALGEGAGFNDVAVSPDGSQIVFVRMVSPDGEATTEPGSEAESSARPQLFVAQLSPDLSAISDIRQVTNVAATQLLWPTYSADGRWIAFASNEDGDFDIYRLAIIGDQHVDKLTDNTVLDTQPAFHPTENNLLLYVSDEQSPGFTDLYLLDQDALDEPAVRLYDGAGGAYQPAWSADGSQIAFISTANADPDVFLINADGSRARQLTIDDGSSEDRAPAWTPDGAYIAFASNRGGDLFQWHIINVASAQVNLLAENDSNAGRLAFVP